MSLFSRISKKAKVPAVRSTVLPVQPGKLSQTREVPKSIAYPPHIRTGVIERPDDVYVFKDPNEIARMRESAKLARRMLDYSCTLAVAGATTDDIDRLTHEAIVKAGAYPSPLQYATFPKSICTSVNEIVCHGIPDDRPLQGGDMLKIDVSLYLNGYHGDNCATVMVGGDALTRPEDKLLIDTTQEALNKAIEKCGPGVCLSTVGATIQSHARSRGLNVVKRFCGHGLGRLLHMAPTVLHFKNNEALELVPGMIFTIEPSLAEGSGDVDIWSDGWTVTTKDGGWSAQFEHEVLITEHGHEVLTLP